MSRQNRQNEHCSDETLIRYLDLELQPGEHDQVREHLGLCWQCRASLADLDRVIHRVATLAREERFPEPWRVAAAKQKFLDLNMPRVVEIPLVQSRKRWLWVVPAAAAAAAAVAVFSVLGTGSSRAPSPVPTVTQISPASLTERVRTAEEVNVPKGATLVQSFRFEARELHPPQRRSEATFEIWSDSVTRQTGVRWMDSSARLISASLQGAERTASPQPLGWTLAERSVEWSGLAEVVSAELSDRGGPLLLVSEFLRFCEYAKVQPIIEAREPRLVLSAMYRSGTRQMKFWVEADPETLQPLRQGITMRNGESAHELILEPRGRTTAPRIDRARFILREPARSAGPAVAEPELPPVVPIPTALPEETEVEVRYALHRARRASDALVIETAAGGQIVVKGIVPSSAHRDELETALAMAGVRDRVLWHVQFSSSGPGSATPAVSPDRRISRSLHAEVWDLAQIAGRYDADSVQRLSPRSRGLLGMIVREKLSAVDTEANRMRTALGEPLGGAVSGPGTRGDWREQVFALYRHAATLDNLVEARTAKPLLIRVLDALQQAAQNILPEELTP